MRRVKLLALAIVSIFIGSPVAADPAATDSETCFFVKDGKVFQARSRADVPAEFRNEMRCLNQKDLKKLESPKGIELEGSLRKSNISSSLGRIELKWQRKAEELFGRSPERGVVEAARAVSKALKQSGFPIELSTFTQDWEVVFMDEASARGQVPDYLVTGCHPGWMVPPSNIYIVVERAAGGCGGAPKLKPEMADAYLATILMHELGHAVEYKLLKQKLSLDRTRAEGFATWFESYAAQYSPLTSGFDLIGPRKTQARQAIERGGGTFDFHGSSDDYARASMYFEVIYKRGGISALLDVYRLITESNLSFKAAAQSRLGVSAERLEEEAYKVASAPSR